MKINRDRMHVWLSERDGSGASGSEQGNVRLSDCESE